MARKDAGKSAGKPPRSNSKRTSSPATRSARETPKAPTRKWLAAGIVAGTIAIAVAGRSLMSTPTAEAQQPVVAQPAASQTPTTSAAPQHNVMAIVNGKDIRREQLAQACVERFGEDALDGLINKRLIEQHCRKRGISVSNADLDAEIDRLAKRFKIGREQWLQLLERERGVTAAEYKQDILWPTLALRKLAQGQLTVEPAELRQAYEQRYGPAVEVRLLVVSSAEKAQQLHQQVSANPDDFARLAIQHSEDVNSASIGGLIQPVRRHSGQPELEQAAFALQPGQVSAPIQAGGQFALLKCERHLRPYQKTIEEVEEELTAAIRDDKLRGVANDLFGQLKQNAQIINVYNDPQRRESMPGVVALINGERVTMQQLGEVCLAKHGVPVLESEISRLLLEQELLRNNLTVTPEDLTAEMTHAARLAGVADANGRVDLEKWKATVTKQQGVAYNVYVRDSVWPSAALKKLTRGKIEVSQEDLDRGFQANYGPRVRCRAVVLGNLRRAQKVWALARENTSMEYFGDLAEEYSVEPTSKSLRGEVPPIRRHGGQPKIEEAAFALQPNELSGILQAGDKFLILKCEGWTDPIDVRPDEVRDVLHQDLFEKKIRIAMSEAYDRVRKGARIDNFLAQTSEAPAARGPRRDTAVQPTSAVR